MTQIDTRPRDPGFTPILAVIAALIAGYLLLDHFGLFHSRPQGIPRPVVARGELSAYEQTSVGIFERNAPSVVHITLQTSQGFFRRDVGTGSGFVWDEQGHVVTNYHVIAGTRPDRDRIQVRMADRRDLTAYVVGADPARDIAVLRFASVPRNLSPVLVGTSKDLKVGQVVFAVGNPFGLDLTLTGGLVSALGRSLNTSNGATLHDLIQTDAAINPGNSGGPLFDSAGRLIGMNTAIFSKVEGNIGIGFAVPVDVINHIVPSLIARRPPERAILGVNLDDRVLRLPPATGFAFAVPITGVAPGYGAEAAGIRPLVQGESWSFPGDAVVAIDDQVVESSAEIIRALQGHNPGDRVKLRLARFRSEADPPTIQVVEVELKAAAGR